MAKTALQSVIVLCCLSVYSSQAQEPELESVSLLTPFRISLPAPGAQVEYLDLDSDGDPDILRTLIRGDIPV